MTNHVTMLATIRQHARLHGLADHVGAMRLDGADEDRAVTVNVPIPGERAATRRLLVWSDCDGWHVAVATLRQERSDDAVVVETSTSRRGLAWDDALAEVDHFLGAGDRHRRIAAATVVVDRDLGGAGA